MHSFLLIGQSNMAGRGFINEACPIDTDRIYILRNGRWQKMFRPINPDRSFSGVSLAESFAEKYAEKHGTDVGLICCADGGTTAEQWLPGSLLYDNAVFNAKLAMRTSTVVGVLWHQGESDCTEERYPQYKKRLISIIDSLRKDLDLQNIPFILGGLGDYLTDCPREAFQFQNYNKINDILRSVAKEKDNVGFVSAKGLTSNPDLLHFNANSLYEFGVRYFKTYEDMCKENPLYTSDELSGDTKRSEMELL